MPEDGVKVYAKTPAAAEPVYYTGLSSGEKLFVSFLVLDMLNQLTGMRMAFIDNLEQLDRRTLEYAHSILTSEEFMESYDHIFVCGVDNQDITECSQAMTPCSCMQINYPSLSQKPVSL